ncbi:MAG: hypothetical protein U1B79_00435 [Candidatus Pacearchaeota archaeon]|nr:hypothetical protein [Nanoarchaeota archaeon]MDZ4226562.1 hypothetical protein [Candidatus Pacearchaeota archaeon]
MTVQYNVPVKVLIPSRESMVEESLKPYDIFTNKNDDNLEDTRFSRENLPYVGKLIVVKTLKKEAAKKAYEILSGIEGLLVLPISECSWEDDRDGKRRLRQPIIKGS